MTPSTNTNLLTVSCINHYVMPVYLTVHTVAHRRDGKPFMFRKTQFFKRMRKEQRALPAASVSWRSTEGESARAARAPPSPQSATSLCPASESCRRAPRQSAHKGTNGCGGQGSAHLATSVGASESSPARSASPSARSDLALTAFGASQDSAYSNHGLWRTSGCGDQELPLSLATSTGSSTSPTSGAQAVQLYPAPPPAHSVTTAALKKDLRADRGGSPHPQL